MSFDLVPAIFIIATLAQKTGMQLEYWRLEYKFKETVLNGAVLGPELPANFLDIEPKREEEEMKLKLTLNLFVGDSLTK